MILYKKLPDPRPIEQYDIIIGRGVEPEVGALLYGIIRMTKPTICVETGLHVGDSAHWIGCALRDNKKGSLVTCDVLEHRVRDARQRFAQEELTQIHIEEAKGIDVLQRHPSMDFVHIDSGSYDVRREELLYLNDSNISPGGIVCYHDATRDMSGIYGEFAEAHPEWPHLVFPSYVGFAVFQRPE